MVETLNIEPSDVYEAPLLVEVGDFTELTRGSGGENPDGSDDATQA